MRILLISVIENGLIESITPFPVYEDQLSEEVLEKGEDFYIEKCKKYGWNEDHYLETEYDLVEEGVFDNTDCGHPIYAVVTMTWIEIN